MELNKYIRQLIEEKERLDAVIATLERLLSENAELAPKSRRGRKHMSPAERREVSRRMKEYWESRRKEIKRS
ncbi:MAG: hypothetical protein JNN08_28915 [Bryobacterales bacterium]|nr:hypothetical protein [Bryobacterales bacterium]